MAVDNITLNDQQAEGLLKTFVNPATGQILGGLITTDNPVVRMLYDAFSPRLTGHLAQLGSGYAEKWTSYALKRLNVPEHETIARLAGKTVAYVLPHIENAGKILGTSKIHKANYEWVMEQVAPLGKANLEAENTNDLTGNIKRFLKNGFEGNKMIEFAVKAINDGTMRNLQHNAIEIVPGLVNNYESSLDLQIRNMREGSDGLDKEALEARLKGLREIVLPVTGVMNASTKDLIKNEDPRNVINHSSLGMVLEIREYMRLHEIGAPDNRASDNEVNDLTDLVERAFQKFQAEQPGRSAIPKRIIRTTARIIANELANGELEALSLVNIIGKDMFLNAARDNIVTDDEQHTEKYRIIAEEVARFSKGSTIDVTEYMKGVNYSLDDVSRHLHSDDPEVKKLAVALHDEAVLVAAGMTRPEIREIRSSLDKEIMNTILEAAVRKIASYSHAELQDMGFNIHSIDLIEDYNANPTLLKQTLESSDKNIIRDLVKNGIMQESNQYWQEIIASSKNDLHEEFAKERDSLHQQFARVKANQLGATTRYEQGQGMGSAVQRAW